MVPVDGRFVKAKMRCVSMLRADVRRCAVPDAFRRSQPGRSNSDQQPPSGLWFHCHCMPNG